LRVKRSTKETPMQVLDRLIVALDVPTIPAASALVERLGDAVSFYKIGYQLAFAGGIPFAANLIRANKRVFLDLKLHDIGNTVAKGVESVARLGATFLTVHAYPQTMEAAVAARGSAGLRILAVTVLTSYNDADLSAAGYEPGELPISAPSSAPAWRWSPPASARRGPLWATRSGS
jgi:orotidine-5'-phosphate decarboxylase